MNDETFDALDYDPQVVEDIRSLRSGYCACGTGNNVYKIMDASKSYEITVPISEPVRARLFHDIVRAIVVTNLLSEVLINGTLSNVSVYEALEDVRQDIMCMCEEYIDYFNREPVMKPEHMKCIDIFALIIEALKSESRIDAVKTFEMLRTV